jgi:hypothetical protein
VSVYGSAGNVDVNGAAPAVLAAVGAPPELIAAIVARRPFLGMKDYAEFMQGNAGTTGLQFGGNSIFTLRATARLRTSDGSPSDLRRSVAATINFQQKNDPPIVVMRWYDRG